MSKARIHRKKKKHIKAHCELFVILNVKNASFSSILAITWDGVFNLFTTLFFHFVSLIVLPSYPTHL